MRVCLVYDCLFPHTVGGAERWYRSLAERLVADGHEVTYLTLRQWERGVDPGVPGVNVVTVGPRMSLYAAEGRRRILPALVFGAGVLWHLIRAGRRYDVVHTASFPYFSLLAAAVARPVGGYSVIVDWFEVWTRAYWREYLGGPGGTVGWLVQALCAKVPQQAFCFSRLHARRLRAAGLRGVPTLLSAAYAGRTEPWPARPAAPVILFAGRLIPEKQATVIPPAIRRVRETDPDLSCVILGDGPDRANVERAIADEGLLEAIELPGFVPGERVEHEMSRALCLLLPSRREGYGLVVIEAASWGTPSIVVAGDDNAAVELIEEGVNGFVAPSAEAETIAAAIVCVHEGGVELRRSTAAWFARNAERLSLEHSLLVVLATYARAMASSATS